MTRLPTLIDTVSKYTLQEENLHRISIIAISLNLNSAHYYAFRNLPMIAHIIEIQKSKFINIQFREFGQSEPSSLTKFRVNSCRL